MKGRWGRGGRWRGKEARRDGRVCRNDVFIETSKMLSWRGVMGHGDDGDMW